MATYEQVIEALRRADAAGNVEDAKRLAEIAQSLKPTYPDAPPALQEGLTHGVSPTLDKGAEMMREGLAHAGVIHDGDGTMRPGDGNLMGQLLQGVSLGTADEIGAAGAGTGGAIAALLRGDNPIDAASQSYNRRLGEIRNANDAYAQEHPYLAPASEVLGGLAAGGPAVKAISEAPSVAAAMKRAATAGAALGGAQGLASGEGMADRLKRGSIGAGAGTVLGAAVPGLGYTTGKILQGAKRMLGLQSPTREAEMLLVRAMQGDELTPAELGSRIGTHNGKPVTIADLGDENIRRLADQVGLQGGPGSKRLNAFLNERQENAGARVTQDIGNTLSPSTDVYGMADDLADSARRTAAPLYEQAYKAEPKWNDDLTDLMKRPSMKQALKRAYGIAAEEGRDPVTLGLDFNSAGDVIYTDKVPTMQTLDFLKRGLDDVLESTRDPVTGRLKVDEAGRALAATRSRFRDLLTEANPEYKAALQAYAGPSQQRSAIFAGRDFMKRDPEQITKMMDRMSEDEQAAFRVGAARALQDRIDSTKGLGDVTKRIFNDDLTKSKIKATFGDKAYDRFERLMKSESSMAQTRNAVTGNSKTAQRMFGAQDIGEQIADDFLTGGKTGVMGGMIKRGAGRLRGVNGPTGAELSDMLTDVSPARQREIIARLKFQEAVDQARQRRLQAIGSVPAIAGGEFFGRGYQAPKENQ